MIYKSRYLDIFQSVRSEVMKLQSDCLLVEEIPAGEIKTDSGIILAGSKRNVDGFEQNKPSLVFVLAVGPGYYDEETGATVATTAKPGDIILTNVHSIKWLSFYGPIISTEGCRVGLARDEDFNQVWSPGEYEEMYAALDSQLKIVSK